MLSAFCFHCTPHAGGCLPAVRRCVDAMDALLREHEKRSAEKRSAERRSAERRSVCCARVEFRVSDGIFILPLTGFPPQTTDCGMTCGQNVDFKNSFLKFYYTAPIRKKEKKHFFTSVADCAHCTSALTTVSRNTRGTLSVVEDCTVQTCII